MLILCHNSLLANILKTNVKAVNHKETRGVARSHILHISVSYLVDRAMNVIYSYNAASLVAFSGDSMVYSLTWALS